MPRPVMTSPHTNKVTVRGSRVSASAGCATSIRRVTYVNSPMRYARGDVLKKPPVGPSLCLRNGNADGPAFFVSLGQQGIRDLDGLSAYDWCKIYHRMGKIAFIPGHQH